MILRFCLATLGVFATLCWIFLGFRHFSTSQRTVVLGEDVAHNAAKAWSRDDFIAAAQMALNEADFDQSHIQALCAKQKWVPDLVFECSMIQGGVGEVDLTLIAA